LTFAISSFGTMLNGCDPISSVDGQVRSAADVEAPGGRNGVAGALVNVRCPNQWPPQGTSGHADRAGYFIHTMISWDRYDDDCVLHAERDGYEPVDIRVGAAKIGEEVRKVHVVIRLKPRTAP
jgi:hypothetical protein